MPTRRGWAVIGAAAGCVIAARSATVKELYPLGVAAAMLPVIAALVVRWGSVHIEISRRIPARRVFPGTRVRIDLDVVNAGGMPSPPLLVEDDAAPAFGGPARFSLASLPPGSRTSVGIERTAAVRGRYAVGPVRMRLVDPFGLAERFVLLRQTDRVTVYPRVDRLGGEGPPAERAGAGPAAVYRLAPEGDEFYAVREYESGDDLRKIHWRSVARTGELMIRQEEARFFPRATIFADTRRVAHRGSGPESSMEWAISAAASAAWHLARQGFALRLATDDIVPAGARTGRDAADPLLEALAAVTPTQTPGLGAAMRRLSRRPGAEGALIAVLPPPSSEDLRMLARLRTLYTWCGAV
ncbi:MAG: DUF58 domain-containing protein, partial [Actinomycetota bacterium]